MDKIKIRIKEITIEVDKGISCYDLMKEYGYDYKVPIVLVKIDGELKELSTILEDNCDLEFIDITDKQGMMCYIRSLQFVLIKATKDLFPDSRITI